MYQTTVGVDGMMCGMCEAHVNDAVRKAFPVKKVTSSHGRGQTVILSEQALDEQAVRSAINATGYTVTSFQCVPHEKKGLFFLPSPLRSCPAAGLPALRLFGCFSSFLLTTNGKKTKIISVRPCKLSACTACFSGCWLVLTNLVSEMQPIL